MMSLTHAAADLVRIVGELGAQLGRPPSYREAAREMSGSLCEVHRLKQQCVERGWMSGSSRHLVLLAILPPPPACAVELTAAGRAYLDGKTAKEILR